MEVAAPSFPHLPPSVLSSASLLPAPVPPMDAAPSLSSLPLAAMELAPAQVRLPLFPLSLLAAGVPSPGADGSWGRGLHGCAVLQEGADGRRINNSNSGIQKPSDWNGIVTNNLNDGIISSDENNLVRGAENAAITRITYETAVSGSILTLVYGDNGSNLAKLTEVLLCNYLT
ncbi:hypothetical protein Zm00014a_039585 [Zea mays]|uniref:Uncharacterized protein n=1 Tax=Zea mays TaxID=4577 RepID=A0A3L6FJX4_MAIZE|nr:hypothetical protein Zm00014a_039585 [Zea mays]